jgi:hypothetical protein
VYIFFNVSVIVSVHYFDMGLSKVEVNLRRLLEAAPKQQNQAKLVHVSQTSVISSLPCLCSTSMQLF